MVGKWYKLLLAVMIFGVVCVIWTSLYGTFSVVGAAAIDGVQARYYIPLMLPFLYLFGSPEAGVERQPGCGITGCCSWGPRCSTDMASTSIF